MRNYLASPVVQRAAAASRLAKNWRTMALLKDGRELLVGMAKTIQQANDAAYVFIAELDEAGWDELGSIWVEQWNSSGSPVGHDWQHHHWIRLKPHRQRFRMNQYYDKRG